MTRNICLLLLSPAQLYLFMTSWFCCVGHNFAYFIIPPIELVFKINNFIYLSSTICSTFDCHSIQEVCRSVTSSVDTSSVASWFHASTAAKALSGCKLSTGGAEKLLSAAISGDSSVADLYYAFFALKNLGLNGKCSV